MIRIKTIDIKRTKVHVRYEFDFKGKVYQKTAKLSSSDFSEFSKSKLFPVIRGLANQERNKLAKPEETIEDANEE